jgi:hypothetical protein
LRHLLSGVLLALANNGDPAIWDSVHGVLLLQAVQLLTLLVGSIFAAGGQRQGLLLGAVIGVWNGVLSVLLNRDSAHTLTAVALYGQPLLQMACGLVGGWVGCTIWKPLSDQLASGERPAPRKRGVAWRKVSLFAGRVAWFRVAAGTALAVAGTLSAAILFDKVAEASRVLASNYAAPDAYAADPTLQDRLITWEIKALALLLGGALAGATTRNGLKQGLCVALCSSAVLVGMQIHFVPRWPQVAFFTVLSAFSLALAGGWFGSQLFPPVVRLPRRRHFDPAALS